jgi:PhoH-like ATPase|tara:strand:+ start:199 stop:1545 length:1347 start_codon:yes stop_codon:yes gene_type:complete
MAKKNYVLDTSVYLTDAESIFKFDNHDIFIPLKVLEEIDKHKKRQDAVGVNARKIIRILDELRAKGDLNKGIRIDKRKGIVKVMSYGCLNNSLQFPPDLDLRIPDHTIIATALAVKVIGQKARSARKTIVVSRDINMRVICDSLGIDSEDYIIESAVTSPKELYQGFVEHLVDDAIVDRFYNNEQILIGADEMEGKWHPNQYIMMVSNANPKKTALARFYGHHVPLKKVIHSDIPDWKIKSRNKEQAFGIDLLMDPKIKIISLVGRAGSGKTLLAIAAGLQQTIGLRENIYSRLIVSRPVQPMGKDIGFLPGSLEEKMLPWLMPIQDNLQYILGGDKTALELFIDKGKIEIEALTYIRGRSISNAFIIIDEAQNLTMHEIKTIITRVGEGTKIVLTGDIEQIDNAYVNETSNGLAHAVEKFKDYSLAGHVTFKKGERSEVATLASKVL